MSTLQPTTGLRDTITSRLGTILLALSVVCAIGVAVLILVPSRHHAPKPIPSIRAAHTQAAPAAPATAATPAPAGSFRDPGTHALLLVHAGGGGGAPLPANHSLGRIIR